LSAFAENKVLEFLFNPYCETSVSTGAFRCHACGAKGDMVSFVMQRDHLDFKAAAVYLGAWDNSALTAEVKRQMAERHEHRKRIDTAADILAEMEAALRLTTREWLCLAERQLNALSATTSWTEDNWRTAAGCYDLLQQDLGAYSLLAFGSIAERARYVLEPEHRAEIEDGIRLAGGVRTDDGRWVEVLQ
jgi:hypothetical protein